MGTETNRSNFCLTRPSRLAPLVLIAVLLSLTGVGEADGKWFGPHRGHSQSRHCASAHSLSKRIKATEKRLDLNQWFIEHFERKLDRVSHPRWVRILTKKLDHLANHRESIEAKLSWLRDEYIEAVRIALEEGNCRSLPRLVLVNPEIEPPQTELPPTFDDSPRLLAATRDATGNSGIFIYTEMVVPLADSAAFIAEYGGEVVEVLPAIGSDTPEMALIRFDPSAFDVDTSELAELTAALSDAQGTIVEVSSRAGLAALTIAAREAAAGRTVGVNWMGEGVGYADQDIREIPEAPGFEIWTDLTAVVPLIDPETGMQATDPETGAPLFTSEPRWTPNVYRWAYLNAGSTQDIGVPEAWTLLDQAGQIDNVVGLAVFDMGFRPDVNLDFPTRRRAWSIVADTDAELSSNSYSCTNGAPCPWHGTSVLTTAAGVADNNYAAVGTGAPVVEPYAVFLLYDLFSTTIALDQARIAGARVINMSYGGWIPAGLEWSMAPFDLTMRASRDAGLVLLTSAGNTGGHVDEGTCIGDLCWESGFNWPCELGNVICVGGLAFKSRERFSASNFGRRAESDLLTIGGSVDIFSPFFVLTGPNPLQTADLRSTGGTSVSSPYVAGIAALVFAADPSLSAGQVHRILIDTAQTDELGDDVSRIVDAQAAVTEALDGACPCAHIVRPEPAQVAGDGRTLVLEMSSYTPDGVALDEVAWSVRRDDTNEEVATANGATTSILANGGGTHTITMTARYDDGSVETDSVRVLYSNAAPKVRILEPIAGTTFTDTESVPIAADVFDPGFPGGLPDSNILWYVDGTLIEDGASFLWVFSGLSSGIHELSVEVTDGYATASDRINFNLVSGGTNRPPIVRILMPTDGTEEVGTYDPATISWFRTFTFEAIAHDPDGLPVTIVWEVATDGGPYVPLSETGRLFLHRLVTTQCVGSNFDIRIRVSDGVFERSDEVRVTVKGAELC